MAEVRICLSLLRMTATGTTDDRSRSDYQVSKSKKGSVFRKHVFDIKEGELPVPESLASEPTHASTFSACFGRGRNGCGRKEGQTLSRLPGPPGAGMSPLRGGRTARCDPYVQTFSAEPFRWWQNESQSWESGRGCCCLFKMKKCMSLALLAFIGNKS